MRESVNILENLQKTPLSEDDRKRVLNDLHIINIATKLGKDMRLRTVVHGGYAVDGNLGQITRPHKDVDIQIYGKEPDTIKVVNDLVYKIKESDPTFDVSSVEDKGRQEYYHNLLLRRPNASGIDLYYLQIVTDPFSDRKVIVKKDGSLSESQSFDSSIVNLEGVEYEVVNAAAELADKLSKRERGDKKEDKHDQDIENLRLMLGKGKI